MRSLESLPAERLLCIKEAELLFSQSPRQAKEEYRMLARRWHPDFEKTPIAPRVFTHLVQLYELAQQKLEDGSWREPVDKVETQKPGIKRFRMPDGSIKAVECISTRNFELGTMFIGKQSVSFEATNEFEDLFRHGRRQIKSLNFEDHAMAAEMSQYLPQISEEFKTGNSQIMVLRKTPDQFLLADILAYYSGKLPQIEHVGWILNVLYNICCYLEWQHISHNAISIDTFFISPLRHAGMLLGGFWYATPIGTQLKAIPDKCLQFIPPDILSCKQADTRSDLELVKALGRELLGDATGAHLRHNTKLPEALTEWLTLPSDGRATADYTEWKHRVLRASFGAPKFFRMNLTHSDLYKED